MVVLGVKMYYLLDVYTYLDILLLNTWIIVNDPLFYRHSNIPLYSTLKLSTMTLYQLWGYHATLWLHNKFEHPTLGMAIFLAFCWVRHYMYNTFSMLSISMGWRDLVFMRSVNMVLWLSLNLISSMKYQSSVIRFIFGHWNTLIGCGYIPAVRCNNMEMNLYYSLGLGIIILCLFAITKQG